MGHLKTAGVAPEEVALIVNTHCHCDHVGGNSSSSIQFYRNGFNEGC